MAVIVDTNALSAWLDGEKQLEKVLRVQPRIVLSPIVLGEFRFGILSSRLKRVYEDILAELLIDFTTLPVDQETAVHYAQIRKELRAAGTPVPWHDLWIAAQARQHQFGVLTQDSHFKQVANLRIISW